jgi:tripartite-type tricarboxylate transporter receptor subunit TctC
MLKDSQVSRRGFGALALGAVALGALWKPGHALAAGYPERTVSFLVPDSGGGSFDAYIREFSHILHSQMGGATFEPVTVPGAGGQAAALRLLTSQPDGYTLGMLNIPGILSSQYRANGPKLPMDSLTWVANLGREEYAFAVSAKGPIKNIADLRALSHKRPVLFPSTGFGSTDYFATRVFGSALKLNFKQILGYTGSAPTIVAVARGEVDGVVHSTSGLRRMEEAGLIRIIFSFQPTADHKIDTAASVGVPDLANIYQWRPIAAPPHTPPAIVARLSDAFVKAARTPEAAAWAKTAGTTVFPLDTSATQAMIKSQSAFVGKWAKFLA